MKQLFVLKRTATQALKKAENEYLEHLNDYLLQMEETKRLLIQIEGHQI
nr:MAG TPA: hypothetical protein [Caudoviricetes sp.]